MRDDKLVLLVCFALAFFVGHSIDHLARGDVPWPPTPDTFAFFAVNLGVFALVGGGLYLYRRGKVGPRFWAIFTGVGIITGWLGHFSPFTDQPPQHILNSYQSPVARWLALGTLIALMLSLITTAIYAGSLWARSRKM